jgi:glycosyltransferase involved in cell wall biosynthesis
MHNVESDLAAMIAPGQRRRGLFGLRGHSEAACIREIEQSALTTVDRVWVCSNADRERLFAQFDVKIPVDVVPNGIPRQAEIPNELAPLPTGEAGFPVMVFVGHLAYAPNVEAAERLGLNILPRVRQAFPSARQILAGRLPNPAVKDLAQLDGVEVIANPDDLAGIYRRGHLSVVPLSSGGGTRIKILEAMAWGLPVVATSLAAEGHGFVAGEEIEISETDDGLAQEIIALCSDTGRLEHQRQMAHRKLTREFGAETIRDAIRKGLGLAGGKT